MSLYKIRTTYTPPGFSYRTDLIISKNEFRCKLEDILGFILVDSEIWELIEDKEIYLGRVSHKSIAYMANEIIEYCIENYYKEEIFEIEVVKSLIDTSRKWIDDTSSVTIDFAKSQVQNSMLSRGFILDCARCAVSITFEDAYCADSSFKEITYHLRSNSGSQMNREKERARQCQFIIDFMKSDKHLFMV